MKKFIIAGLLATFGVLEGCSAAGPDSQCTGPMCEGAKTSKETPATRPIETPPPPPAVELLALGSACVTDTECTSGICNVAGSSHGFCTKPCDSKEACTSVGMECIDPGFVGNYCVPSCAETPDRCSLVPDSKCIVYPNAMDGQPVSICLQ